MNSHSKKHKTLKETKHERDNENNCQQNQTHDDFEYRSHPAA